MDLFRRSEHSAHMMPSIAFVGAGPTTIYTLHALLNHAVGPLTLTIFEEQAIAGQGTPYRPGWNDPAMLSNIASIEIPPLRETLVVWLQRQPRERLAKFGLDPLDINDRAFYPRLALGEFFKDQFWALIDHAKVMGMSVNVRTRCRVTDAVSHEDGIVLTIKPKAGEESQERFDHLVLATGHHWPADPQVRPGYFVSPWPASALSEIPPSAMGIRGTSLTAIDAAVALAFTHGDFIETEQARLRYIPKAKAEPFHLTMMSRKGLLPEADFFHPVPYEPLTICTPAAIERLIDTADPNLLDESFSLFKKELASIDPKYASEIRLEALDLEGFCDRYFAERLAVDTFEWAKNNLKEAEQNYCDQVTVPWRYAILRMHEVVALIVPHLNDDEFERFSRHFKPIFVDDYATVPHESIKRMLALHQAGKLDIIALGKDYKIDGHRPEGGAIIQVGKDRLEFPVFIDATGQRTLRVK